LNLSTCIQFWRPDKTQALQLQYTIQMKEGSQRNTYPDTKNTSLLSGVLTYNSNSIDSKHHTLNFAGYEARVPEIKLQKLRESDYWPKSYVRDELGRECPEPDKAKGHCAVTFSRSSKKTIGSLDIQWAVFLPVDTGREKIPCKSEYAYELTLHGFFFIDAGRSAIEGIDINESDVSFPPQSENDLRIAWNYFLVTRGTFILLIPALEKFIHQSKIGVDEVKNLTASIASSSLFKDHRHQICRFHQWVLRIVPQGSKWVRIKSDQKIIPLPAPPQKKPNQPWETFPNLSDLENNFIFIQKNDPVSENFDREIYHLTTTRIPQWDEETLLTVLDFDSEKVFSSLSIVNYLKLFLQDDSVSVFLKISSLQNRLKNLVREGFLRVGLQMSQVTSGVQEIVSLILPEHKYIIKSDAHTVITGLQEVDSGFLILHKDFDSPNSSGTAKLTTNDSLRFLENLDQQMRNYEIKGEIENTEKCREVILEILKSLDNETCREVLQIGKTLKIITAYDCQLKRNSSFTVKEIEEFQDKASLFLNTQGINLTERLGLSLKLQSVFINDKILLLNSNTAKIVFGSEKHGIQQCLAKGCLESLGHTCKPLSDEQTRADLIGSVSGVDLHNVGSNSIRGFRYLLHGDKKLFAENSSLWVQRFQQSSAWSKLWKQLTGNEEGNVLVNRALAEKIPQDDRWNLLGLREIKQQEILNDIREKGTAFIQQTCFNEEERTEVLLGAQHDRELWQNLPFHKTVSGDLVPITESTYLEPQFIIPDKLRDYISIIQKSSEPRLYRLQNDKDYIQPLTDAILIETILNFSDSHKFHQFILDAMFRSTKELKADLEKQICDVKWIIDKKDLPLCPGDVICLPGMKDEVIRLIAEEPGSFWQADDLSEEICNHPYFTALGKRFFSHGQEGLEKLTLLLEQNRDYAIGDLYITNEDFSSMLNIFGNASFNQYLPGWRLLQAVSDSSGMDQSYQYVLKSVSNTLSNNKLIMVLNWLQDQHSSTEGQRKKDIFTCHLRYLEVFSKSNDALILLKDIKLLNQSNEWRTPAEICIDTEGISPSFLLNTQQRKCLNLLFQHQESLRIKKQTNHEVNKRNRVPIKRYLEPELKETAENLSVYFCQWERLVQPEIICGFLSILGDDSRMLKLADYYKGKHSINGIRAKIPCQLNHQAFSKHKFIVELVSGSEVVVDSLTEEKISVSLSEIFSGLILDKPFYEYPADGIYHVKIKLRKVDEKQVSPEQFSEYLKSTAEYLLKTVYHQKTIDLTSLWDELNKSEQLGIRIALRLVMKHIPFYLDQLGVHKHQSLRKAYNAWDEARYKTEEYHDIPEQSEKYQKEEEKSRQGLQKLLETDSVVQQVVLESVRKKMRDFQYNEKSIPFELFQNADDAVVEQLEIDAYPESLETLDILSNAKSYSHFVVQKENNTIRFMHWGRPVNSIGSGGFPGRQRGFHQDLEKMLILSSSNKSSESLLTGKFGLGFKSLLLVSDQPRFISGRLGVEIIAGLYPRPLLSHNSLFKLLSSFSLDNKKLGTLIELPLKQNVNEKILHKFKRLSGVLTVFSKKIRRIDLIQKDEGHDSVEWLPDTILSTPETKLEKGSLILWEDDDCNTKRQVDALHFRCSQGGGLLVGIESHGLVPLPVDLPPIWIVSPTKEKGRLGFCINGEFDVDAGRARLAGESGKNTKEAKRIGQSIGEMLCFLFQKTIDDWSVVRYQLRLLPGLTHYQFWESVWTTLTQSWFEPSEKQLDSEVLDVVSNLIGSNSGLGMLIREKNALPNGLWGNDFQRLIDPKAIRYVLRDSLSEKSVFSPLSKWQVFKERIDPESVISARIFPALGKIHPGFTQKKDQWQSLRLNQVIDFLKENHFQIDRDGADILGGIITRDFLDKLPGTIEGEIEFEGIKTGLKKLKFQTQFGEWKESIRLLRTNSFGSGDDEPLRACFSPVKNILHESYTGAALDFFLICRGEMTANADTMAKWILNAETDDQKKGALIYLVNGELGDQVAKHLRYKEIENTWLAGLRFDSEYFNGWSEGDIKELLFRKLPSITVLERWREGDDYYEQKTTVIQPVDVTKTLQNIYDWWQINKFEYLVDYESRTYPDNSFFSGLTKDDRSAWLTLLMIGAFHTFGRARPEQHRNFLSLCQQKGWWAIFARENPKERSDEWMGILEDYIDDQVEHSKFEYWMQLFPTIYKFAREIEEYIEIFYSLETQGKDVNVKQAMAPKTFSDFQGGGITAAPIARTLGMGVPFVLREMMRKNLFSRNQENINPYCYVPIGRVRNLFSKMGCPDLENDESFLVKSEIIHHFLCEHLGPDKANFDGFFDIPFQYVAEDLELQEKLFV